MRYLPAKIEEKWRKKWLKEGVYEPDFRRARKPFYNLMMFPYPSAEGLHIGSVRTFSGIDIYGRFKRMQGHDVFEPIGLDGFGIHSENYALKVGKHPFAHAKDSEKNFYRQLGMIGNGFAWEEKLETYDPNYYKWTQWIFTQMFKHGLAYRKKAAVNWCPSCKTVLADEQVLHGECERCQSKVIKKDLEQWFFKITDYADRLLKNLGKIDWPEPIKVAQRNWIGKSEGAEIIFPLKGKYNFILLHGYGGSAKRNFIPWLKAELEKREYTVQAPKLPNTNNPKEEEQVGYVLKNCKIDGNTIIVGHSLGGIVAMKALLKYGKPIKKLILIAPAMDPSFPGAKKKRIFWDNFTWNFDYQKIKNLSGDITVLSDLKENHRVPYLESLAKKLKANLITSYAEKEHFSANNEPVILENLQPSIKIFTTRPDTLFGATYMVLGPEHQLIQNLESRIQNSEEVQNYIKKALAKTDEERIAEGKEKTGVELKGVKAVNPANGEEIPVWVADYVLGNVGTGAIMAVPAHDERDFAFAKKYNLPIKIVICSNYPEKTCPVLDEAYVGGGHLVGSGKFDGMVSEKAKWEITKLVGGNRKVQFRLRDWLISRQRYWGPPIPMIYCENCAKKNQGERKDAPGWYTVSEKDLPVKLPYIKDYRPAGTGRGPLAAVESFYKVRCPKCKSWARRETDVSDTFLDSAWYYLGYLMASENWKLKIGTSAFAKLTRQWLPVDSYIGGAEHAVLHLLYVRFLAMAFYDWKLVYFEEPFKQFRTHGLITKDGAKMSKSRGNIVNPDEYINAYGSDAIRMYLAFLAPLTQGGDFRDEGIKGITRFLERVYKIISNFQVPISPDVLLDMTMKSGSRLYRRDKQMPNPKLQTLLHKTIKKVTEDNEILQYNTAISALMILLNEFEKNLEVITRKDVEVFLKLLAPFAPHITEELWQEKFASGKKLKSIHLELWPKYDPKLIQEDTFELVIQINGKMRGKVTLPTGTGEKQAREAALKEKTVREYLAKEPRKVIFVPDKLINFVV